MTNGAHRIEKVTNLQYLAELSGGDQNFVKEMIRLFLLENPLEIKMLEEGIQERNFQQINMAAHKLRSSLPFVGIEKLIEKEVEEIEIISVDNAIQKIEIAPDDEYDSGKIEIITTNLSVLEKIETLFPKVKSICEKARNELKAAS